MKRSAYRTWVLLLAMLLIAGIFLALDFKAAFSTTTDNAQVATIRLDEGQAGATPLVIFAQAPDNLAEPLRQALFKRVGTLTLGSFTPFSTMALTETPASGAGSAALVVVVERRTNVWTPLYATANLSVRVAFASDGKVDWKKLGEIDTVVHTGPVIRMSGDLEIRDRSVGLISQPGFQSHIAGQISDKVVESLNTAFSQSTPAISVISACGCDQ